ncbi:MAG: DUF4189 domain-containing protein [Oscillatoriales cyanobacterium SM2_2_1]|nr:DUF4189 domain-containing protein [Oscillatoriales cyanobacterium SM2_2_1]
MRRNFQSRLHLRHLTLWLAGTVVAQVMGLGLAVAQDFYGAIATSESGSWGYAYDFNSRSDAEKNAIAECGETGCQVRIWFKNACGAVAKDDKSMGWGWAETRAQAETNALDGCSSRSCRVQAWVCTTR